MDIGLDVNRFPPYGISSYRILQYVDGMFKNPQTTWGAPSMNKYPNSRINMWASGTRSNTGYPEDSVLGWVVQDKGSYQVTGVFTIASGSGNGMDVYVKKNNSILWSSYMLGGATQMIETQIFEADTGDTIYIGVGAHNNNSFSELNDGAALTNPHIVRYVSKGDINLDNKVDLLDCVDSLKGI